MTQTKKTIKKSSSVKLKLDKERSLRYDLNAFAEIEDALSMPIQDVMKREIGMRETRILLWAGLIHEDEELTVREVGRLVSLDNMEYVNKAIAEAFAAQKN